MAQLVLGVAGAVAGSFFGPLGTQIGFAIGSYLGAGLGPAQKQQGPRLSDLKAPTVGYGAVIPYVEGHPRVPGAIAWQSDKREIGTTVSSGKGGPSVESTTYTYECDVLYILAENQIAGVRRIWSNGELIWTSADDADTESIVDSATVVNWRRMTVYTGEETQLPDPTYEAAFGVGNVPANRGRGSIFFEGLNLGSTGQFPILTFEVVQQGSTQVTGWTENFDDGSLSEYTGADPDVFQVVDSPWGSALYIVGGNEPGASSTMVREDFDDVVCDRVTFKFKVTTTGYVGGPPDDAAIITIANATDTILEFTPRREQFYDSLQRAYMNGVPVTSVILVDDNWYSCEYLIAAGSPQIATVTIRDLTNGLIVQITNLGSSAVRVANKLRFDRMYSPVAGTLPDVWYDDIVVGTGGLQLSMEDVPLDEVVERQCERGGLSLAYVDASALSVLRVRAMALTQIVSPRQVIDMLAAAYHFEAVEMPDLQFVLRGGASAVTITYDDLGAADGADPEPLPLVRNNDIELPAQVVVKFMNVDDDYQDGAEESDRMLTGSSIVQTVELPLGLTPTEAKRIADVAVTDAAAGIIRVGPIMLSRRYAAYVPTDVVTLTGHDGSTFRTRMLKLTESAGIRTYEGVLDDASAVSSSAVTSGDYTNSTSVRRVNDTLSMYLDIPILRDADNDQGYYWAAKADGDRWSGAALYGSRDAVAYARITDITDQAIFGVCTTTLGDWSGGRVVDELNSVTVDVGSGVSLSSSTRDAVLDDQSINAFLIGSEVLQAINCTFVSDGVYTLSRLLRGSRGTEWAMIDHEAAERCVLLRTTGLRRVPMETFDIGVERNYKAVSFGLKVENAYPYPFTHQAVGLEPFSPFDLRASRDPSTSDITLTWQRRSRLAVRTIGTAGISIPLGEWLEAYSIDIYSNGSYSTVLRTLTVTSASTVQYTSAQQVADFGSNQATVYVKVYQMSDIVGRGYPLQAAA